MTDAFPLVPQGVSLKRSKRLLLIIFLCMSFSIQVRADMFGADVAVLAQILSNAIQQLAQLRAMVSSGQDSLDLMREINRGINDSLNMARTVGINPDAGIYGDLQKGNAALSQILSIYGESVRSQDQAVQIDADQSVAEAISSGNAIYEYTKEIDALGEEIKAQSHDVSPGGAAKLTAQSLGVLLHVQNEGLRTQARILKLQAQALAIQNRKDKAQSKMIVQEADFLKGALQSSSPEFTLPRF